MAMEMKRWSILCLSLLCTVVSDTVLASGFPDVLAKVKPAIVGVGTHQPTRRPPSRLLGTGFAVSDGSLIATNAHVVERELNQAAHEQLVVFVGSGKQPRVHPAKIIAVDRKHDLAVLRIATRLPSLALKPDGQVREGEVYAFTGFPIGAVLGLYPVTHRGMVSSITPVAIPSPSAKQLNPQKIKRLRDPIHVYQLDATAYPGNSGSPVYDMESAEVIGILNQVYVKSTKEDVLSSPSGISYAIPVNHLRSLIASTPK